MAMCPRCGTGKLVKNKSTNAYYCQRHGFVRKAMSPPETQWQSNITQN